MKNKSKDTKTVMDVNTNKIKNKKYKDTKNNRKSFGKNNSYINKKNKNKSCKYKNKNRNNGSYFTGNSKYVLQ